MTFSVLINNHNYGRFLDRALASVAAQTRPADEIIVVDDGSTDDSLAVGRRWAERDHRVRVIAQKNQGQLSAINTGFAAATGDIVCFLDADDEYLPGWLDRLEREYAARPDVDYMFCQLEVVGADGGIRPPCRPQKDFDFGLTYYRTLIELNWISSPTSGISARRSLLARFLPCAPAHAWVWRTHADDVLVYGASIVMGHKFRIGQAYVRYHEHGANVYHGRPANHRSRLKRRVAVLALLEQLAGTAWQGGLWRRMLPRLIYREFLTLPRPRFRDACHYARLIFSVGGSGWWRRLLMVWARWLAVFCRGRSIPPPEERTGG